MGNIPLGNLLCDTCIKVNAPPPTIQIETDLDYNSGEFSRFEFITFNYKGDAQYYNTESLRNLTSGILPVVVYPSISPFSQANVWPSVCFCNKGTGNQPQDIDPTKPYNANKVPQGWISLSNIINNELAKFDYNHYGPGSLLPQSNYILDSMKHHGRKTVSLFCALYHSEVPSSYKLKLEVSDNLTFYVLDVQNGD